MHSGLLITGLTMLFGSFIVVLICHHCKRRSIRKKQDQTNIPQAHPPFRTTVACIIEGNSKTSEYLKTLTPTPRPPQWDSSSIRSNSSAGSNNECRVVSLPPPKSPSPRWLSVPKHGAPKRHGGSTKANSVQRTIPSIYVESGCYTNTEFNV